MKSKIAWMLFSSLGLGLGLMGYAGGCGGSTGGGTGGEGGDATTSTTGSAGSSTASTSSGVTDDGSWLALECASDDDCGTAEGAFCVTASMDDPAFLGGPSGGYCSKKCSVGGDCPGTVKTCFKGPEGKAAEGRCVAPCELGPALEGLDDPLLTDKCQGRERLMCQKLNSGSACMPACGNDAHCDSGFFCDPKFAVCTKAAPMGKTLGEKCDGAMDASCAGICITGGDQSVCTSRCAMGGDIFEDCVSINDGLCILFPSDPSAEYGAGDAGYCAPGCKAHDDCVNPSMWCLGIMGAPNGYCVPGFPKCDSQAVCDMKIEMKQLPAGYQCVETAQGKYCIDPKIPLTSGGGAGGAGGAGGTGGAGGAGGGGGAGGAGGDAGAGGK